MSQVKAYQFHPSRPRQERMEVEEQSGADGQGGAGEGGAGEDGQQWRLQSMDWCSCGHCCNMNSVEENVCCRELPNVLAMIEEGCITEAVDFEAVVLRRGVLAVAIRSRNNLRRTTQREPFTHDLLRHQAYTQFTLWVHDRLGRRVRRVVPACAAHLIHKQYPDATGQYHGFEDVDSD